MKAYTAIVVSLMAFVSLCVGQSSYDLQKQLHDQLSDMTSGQNKNKSPATSGPRTDNHVSEARLLGTWKYSNGNMDFSTTYSKDRTWVTDVSMKVDGVVISSFKTTGDWRLEGDRLICDYRTCSNPNMQIKQRHTESRIIKVDDTSMTQENSNGNMATSRRVLKDD